MKFELIQAFMHVLVTCKNEDDTYTCHIMVKNVVGAYETHFFTISCSKVVNAPLFLPV